MNYQDYQDYRAWNPHGFPAQVHATRCKKFARSSFHEAVAHLSSRKKRSLKAAANTKCVKNAERDLHRLFRREGLSLPITPECEHVGSEVIHYLKLDTWFGYLMKDHPQFLLGGFDRKDPRAGLLLSSFWGSFSTNFPDHAVFDLHDQRLNKCLPYFLHIDEGVGQRKSSVLVISMQCVFGRETSKRFSHYYTQVACHAMEKPMVDSQYHNAKGSTYLTRFLYTALPKKSYSGRNSHVYWKVMENIKGEIVKMMNEGVVVGKEVYYPICLGLKGDQPALIKAGKFTRSFRNMGEGKMCCWECCAGLPGFPWEDTSKGAAWVGTVGITNPWSENDPSPFSEVPCRSYMPHAFWKRDPFHAFKQTIGGHFGASTLVLFAIDFGLWRVPGESRDVEVMLQKAYDDFRFFVTSEWRGLVINHTKAFTRQTLHFADYKKFPFARWKGSDQMLIIRWLRHLVLHGPVVDDWSRAGVNLMLNPPQVDQAPFYGEILKACNSSLAFFHVMHTAGLWLDICLAKDMSANCLQFCETYNSLALMCHNKGLARFHLEPSLHTFRHFSHDLDEVLGSGATKILSPSSQTCEMDEDFVGKICRGSRHVHAGVMCKRTIDRYLLRCHAEFQSAREHQQ